MLFGMGLLDVPSLDKTENILYLILGVLFGGLFFIIWGLIKGNKDDIIRGVIFLVLTFVFGVGHILAIVWAIYTFIKNL